MARQKRSSQTPPGEKEFRWPGLPRWYTVIRLMELAAGTRPLYQQTRKRHIVHHLPPRYRRRFRHQLAYFAGMTAKRRQRLSIAPRELRKTFKDLQDAARDADALLAGVGGDGEKIDAAGRDALIRFDNAVMECVGIDKTCLWDVRISSRIETAQQLGDNDFGERLAKAVRRRVTLHRGSQHDIVRRAAELFDAGFSSEEAYDRIPEAGKMGFDSFLRLLKRYRVNPPKGGPVQ